MWVPAVERLYCKKPIQCLASSEILTPHGPTPHRQASVYLPAFGAGGGHTRWVERGWGVNSSEDARHCSVLYICKYFVPFDKKCNVGFRYRLCISVFVLLLQLDYICFLGSVRGMASSLTAFLRSITIFLSIKVSNFCKMFNPHQNDQGWKGPCFFQRLIALKCLKCQKIKKNI